MTIKNLDILQTFRQTSCCMTVTKYLFDNYKCLFDSYICHVGGKESALLHNIVYRSRPTAAHLSIVHKACPNWLSTVPFVRMSL